MGDTTAIYLNSGGSGGTSIDGLRTNTVSCTQDTNVTITFSSALASTSYQFELFGCGFTEVSRTVEGITITTNDAGTFTYQAILNS